MNRNNTYQTAQKANVIKSYLMIVAGSIQLLFLFFKAEDRYYRFALAIKGKNRVSGGNFIF
jgi:hypothetical protein